MFSMTLFIKIYNLHSKLLENSKSCRRRHPHRDAEIFSYIVDGELSHQDSMGNKESFPRGCVQYLSAGTGISHSVRCFPNQCPLNVIRVQSIANPVNVS